MIDPSRPVNRHSPPAGPGNLSQSKGQHCQPTVSADAAIDHNGPERRVVNWICDQGPYYETPQTQGIPVLPMPESFTGRNETEMTGATQLLGTIG